MKYKEIKCSNSEEYYKTIFILEKEGWKVVREYKIIKGEYFPQINYNAHLILEEKGDKNV